MGLKVLHVTPSFFPATYYGGAIVSVYGLCNSIAAHREVELRVLTTDTLGPRLADRFVPDDFPSRLEPGYDVYYCRRLLADSVSPGLWARLPALVRWADVVHLTGVYSPPTIPTLAISRFLAKPMVWSPRGSLQRWEGASNRPAKALWELACRALLPKGPVILHVTSDEEGAASAARFPSATLRLIPNGVDIPDQLPPRDWRPQGALRLMLLARLHPIKGIENLVRALAALPSYVNLTIYGTGEESYVESLRRLVAKLGVGDRVKFAGRIDSSEKAQAFSKADLSVVPSFSENFGMSVAESLAHGVPVIASRGTPWKGLDDRNCGVWVENTAESLSDSIVRLGDRDLREMGDRGRRWMQEEYSWRAVGTAMVDLYGALSERG